VSVSHSRSARPSAQHAQAGATDAALIGRLSALHPDRLAAMYAAAAEATASLAALAKAGFNPVTAALDGACAIEEWQHFPPGDARDPGTNSQYYYHAHAASERIEGEHGHFHTFVRAKRILSTPQRQPAVGGCDAPVDEAAVTHLIGISTDASGRLIRLFTTNRWVTGEAWYDAATVIAMLDHFDMTVRQPRYALNRWITAVVAMFRPQIEDLLRARDVHLMRLAAEKPGRSALEDRALHITSQTQVDFLAQIGTIEAACAGMAVQTATR